MQGQVSRFQAGRERVWGRPHSLHHPTSSGPSNRIFRRIRGNLQDYTRDASPDRKGECSLQIDRYWPLNRFSLNSQLPHLAIFPASQTPFFLNTVLPALDLIFDSDRGEMRKDLFGVRERCNCEDQPNRVSCLINPENLVSCVDPQCADLPIS